MKSHQLKENMVQKIIKLLDEYKVPQDEDNEEDKIDEMFNILERTVISLINREVHKFNHYYTLNKFYTNIENILKDSEV